MLLATDTVLEVDGLGKLYARTAVSSRARAAAAFGRAFFWRHSRPPKTLRQDEFWSLKDISFSLKRGEALGVIGFNGAGKTTLLRILAGQILPDVGEVRIMGNTAAMIDLTAGFSGGASGRQNIYLRGAMLGRSRAEIDATVDEIIDFAELGDAIDAPFSTYSSGMSMRLAFSIMIASEPDILFIDEILSVGDFRFQQKCLARIREIRERVVFVLVSHSMANIKLFCDKVIVLHEGEIVFTGEPGEAIQVYEELKFPPKTSREEKHREILKPQFHNEKAITELEHFWCDKDGCPIDEIRSGETLYFRATFKINHLPRNLIMGIPVWSSDGKYVTGFSTELGKFKAKVTVGEEVEFTLAVPNLALNKGEYISNFGITDGPEFLYRAQNPMLTVIASAPRYWGVVTLPHEWQQMTREAESIKQ